MLSQMLTGELPAKGNNQEVMDAHLKGKLDFSPIRNKALKRILEKATEKDPAKRYSSAADFSAALSSVEVQGMKSSISSHALSSYGKTSAPKSATDFNIPSFIIPASCAAGLITGIIISLIII